MVSYRSPGATGHLTDTHMCYLLALSLDRTFKYCTDVITAYALGGHISSLELTRTICETVSPKAVTIGNESER